VSRSPFAIELLAAAHKRANFACGNDALDRYLRQQASQDMRRHVSACFVAREIVTEDIAAYYTLAAGGVLLSDLPDPVAKKLPRYPSVPVARVGRLAIAQNHQGHRLGAALLWDAAVRAERSEVAVYALVVDAKDDRAAAFYRHHGFIELRADPHQLFMPLRKR